MKVYPILQAALLGAIVGLLAVLAHQQGITHVLTHHSGDPLTGKGAGWANERAGLVRYGLGVGGALGAILGLFAANLDGETSPRPPQTREEPPPRGGGGGGS